MPPASSTTTESGFSPISRPLARVTSIISRA
jgi:hypothetical protein